MFKKLTESRRAYRRRMTKNVVGVMFIVLQIVLFALFVLAHVN